MDQRVTPGIQNILATKTRSFPWVGLLMSALVAAAAVIAFWHRPAPVFPQTQATPRHMLVNGIGAAGNRLVATGELGHIFVSENGGQNWTEARVTPQRGSTLTQVFFVDANLGFAVGHDHWILRTEDGGRSWVEVQFDSEHSEPLLGIWAKPGGSLYVVGGFGYFSVTNDRGQTWQRNDINLGDSHLYALAGGADSRMLLVGEQGLVARSEDSGVTWTKVPQFYQGSFFGVIRLTPDEWIAYGMRGSVYATRDFGKTWQKAKSGVAASLFGGTVTSKGRIVLVGQGDTIIVSDDRGATFRSERPSGGRSLTAVTEMADGKLLLGGESGIDRTTLALPAQRR